MLPRRGTEFATHVMVSAGSRSHVDSPELAALLKQTWTHALEQYARDNHVQAWPCGQVVIEWDENPREGPGDSAWYQATITCAVLLQATTTALT